MDDFSLFTYILSYSRNEDPAETIPKNNVEPSADNSLMQQPCVIAWVKYIPFDPWTLTDGLLAYHTIYISFSDTFLSFLSEERIHLWNYDGFRNLIVCFSGSILYYYAYRLFSDYQLNYETLFSMTRKTSKPRTWFSEFCEYLMQMENGKWP